MKIKLYLSALFIAFAAFTAHAEEKTIAIIDFDKLSTTSKALKNVVAQIESEVKRINDYRMTNETALKKENEELQKQEAILSREVFQKKAVEFNQKVSNYQAAEQEKRNKIETARAKAFEKFENTVKNISKNLAEKEGYKMVLSAQLVIFYDKTIDITEQVLKDLDKNLPDLKLEL